MWEIGLNHQALTVVLSVFVGFVFCLIFDTIKAIRVFLKLKTFGVFISDVLFFIIISPLEFCFLLSRSFGEIRGFILVAQVMGFFCFRSLISKTYIKLLIFLLNILRKASDLVGRTFQVFSEKVDKIVKFFLKKGLFLRKKG